MPRNDDPNAGKWQWGAWLAITNPKGFDSLLGSNLRHAGKQIGHKGVAMLTDLFTSDPDPPMVPNAPLTVAIKGKNNPLTDKLNSLARSHAFDQPEDGIVRIGSKATSDRGRDITRALHYGFSFDLKRYPKMQKWLVMKLAELERLGKLQPGEIRGPKGRKGFIVIPPRPWMGWLFSHPEFVQFVISTGQQALRDTMRGIESRTGKRPPRRDSK